MHVFIQMYLHMINLSYLGHAEMICAVRYGEVLPVEEDRRIASSEKHIRYSEHRCSCLSYRRDDVTQFCR